jgi:hypothetical protein
LAVKGREIMAHGVRPQVVPSLMRDTPQFRPGDQVFWWKRVTRAVEYPYRAEVVAVGTKRITLTVEDPDDASDRSVRHVATERL